MYAGTLGLSGNPGRVQTITGVDGRQTLADYSVKMDELGNPSGIHVSVETNGARWGFGPDVGHVLGAGSDLKFNGQKDILDRMYLGNQTAGSNATMRVTVFY